MNDVANYCVRGQYRGYRDEPGVAPDSQTPTYAAMRFMIDSWRWQGVPFYLRAGKKLAARRTEVVIHFKRVPLVLFREEAGQRASVAGLRSDHGLVEARALTA